LLVKIKAMTGRDAIQSRPNSPRRASILFFLSKKQKGACALYQKTTTSLSLSTLSYFAPLLVAQAGVCGAAGHPHPRTRQRKIGVNGTKEERNVISG
jgi:hypothetical protein